MIFIFFTLFVIADAFIHKFLIDDGINPTPDGQGIIGALPESFFRVFWGAMIWLLSGEHRLVGKFDLLTYEFLFYVIGCFGIHLLVFGPLLNCIRADKKPLFYLGNGPTDRFLMAISKGFPHARIVILGIVIATGVFTFYNTHLLS